MSKSAKRIVLLAVAVVLVGSAVGGVLWYRAATTPKRFDTVVEGKLYRSAQPLGGQFAVLKKYGITTVLDLCLADERIDEQPDAMAVEKQACAAAGVKWVHRPMIDTAHNDAPTDVATLNWFVDLMARADGPVLVHCQHGRNRTGMLVAAYRVKAQGWSVEQAMKEYVDHGGEHKSDQIDQALRAFRDGPATVPATAASAPATSHASLSDARVLAAPAIAPIGATYENQGNVPLVR